MTERHYAAILGAYERSLGWVMDRRRMALAFSAAILVATVALFVLIPKGFLPSEDTGQLFGTTEAIEGISFDAMKRASAGDRGHREAGSERRGLHVGGRRRRAQRDREPGAPLHPPQAAIRAEAARRRKSCASSCPSSPRCPGCASSSRCRRRSGSAAGSRRASTSSAAEPRHPVALPIHGDHGAEAPRAARPRERHDGSPDQEPADQRRT